MRATGATRSPRRIIQSNGEKYSGRKAQTRGNAIHRNFRPAANYRCACGFPLPVDATGAEGNPQRRSTGAKLNKRQSRRIFENRNGNQKHKNRSQSLQLGLHTGFSPPPIRMERQAQHHHTNARHRLHRRRIQSVPQNQRRHNNKNHRHHRIPRHTKRPRPTPPLQHNQRPMPSTH